MTKTLALLVTCVLLLFVSCSPAGLQIGVFLSLTGATSAYGVSAANAIQMAADEINTTGGVKGALISLRIEDDHSNTDEVPGIVKGALISLRIEDDHSNTDEVPGIVNRLIKERKVKALLAEPVSTRALAAAPVAQQNQIVMISSASVKPELTMQGDYIFRACFVSSTEGEAIAKFARETLKARTVAIILDPKNDYAAVLGRFFAESFRLLGGQLISQQNYEANATDLQAQMAEIKSAAPDVIFAPGFYTTAPLVAREVKRAGIKATLIGSDGWDSPDLLKNDSNVFEGVYFANHFWIGSDDPYVQRFVTKYRERYHVDPDAGAATAYDAAHLLFDAFKRARSDASADVRDALAQTRDFPGVTGKITIDANRNAQVPVYILRIEGGKFTLQH